MDVTLRRICDVAATNFVTWQRRRFFMCPLGWFYIHGLNFMFLAEGDRGSGVNFSCKACIKVRIVGVSALFKECQNFSWSGKYVGFNFQASILYYCKFDEK